MAGAAQGLVKQFFNEKEVTSTLVMDALFSGCKQVEEASRAGSGPKVRPMMLHTFVLVLQTHYEWLPWSAVLDTLCHLDLGKAMFIP